MSRLARTRRVVCKDRDIVDEGDIGNKEETTDEEDIMTRGSRGLWGLWG